MLVSFSCWKNNNRFAAVSIFPCKWMNKISLKKAFEVPYIERGGRRSIKKTFPVENVTNLKNEATSNGTLLIFCGLQRNLVGPHWRYQRNELVAQVVPSFHCRKSIDVIFYLQLKGTRFQCLSVETIWYIA